MLFKRTLTLIVFTITLPMAAVAIETTVETVDHAVQIGESTVTLREFRNGDGPTFLRVHHNEVDAGDVGKKIVTEGGGRFIDLVHPGGRSVSFTLDGAKFWFDPNRIFTKEGIVRTVHGQRKDTRVLDAVQAFADRILVLCGNPPVLVALHNNSGGTFGLHSYLPGGTDYLGAGKSYAHLGEGGVNNFLIVTTMDLFTTFANRKVSVAYQVPAYDKNDGSLSYRFGKDGKAYINVEVLLGRRELQMQIVRGIHKMLTEPTAALLTR